MGCARYCAVSVAVSVAGSATKLIQVYVNILTPTSMENATHFARRPQTDAQQQQPVWGGKRETEGEWEVEEEVGRLAVSGPSTVNYIMNRRCAGFIKQFRLHQFGN